MEWNGVSLIKICAHILLCLYVCSNMNEQMMEFHGTVNYVTIWINNAYGPHL